MQTYFTVQRSQIAALFLLLLFAALAAFGQGTTGAIDVTVTDNTGAVIPGAKVSALNLGTGAEYRTESDASGRAQFLLLHAGSYRVTVEQQGFEKLVRDGVIVNSAEIAYLGLKVSVGAVNETAAANRACHSRPSGGGAADYRDSVSHAEFHSAAGDWSRRSRQPGECRQPRHGWRQCERKWRTEWQQRLDGGRSAVGQCAESGSGWRWYAQH
jgi:hypothetical protein